MRKNILVRTFLCLIFAVSSILFVACKGTEVSKIEVLSGVPQEVYQNETIDLSNLKVKATYKDGSSKDLGIDDVTYTFSSAELGDQELVITVKDTKVSTTVKVTVVERIVDDAPEIMMWASSLLNSRQEALKSFTDKNSKLFAGCDNYFDLQISGTTSDGQTITEFETIITILMQNGDNWEEIPNLVQYAEVVNKFNRIQFTENAVDKTFKIIVKAKKTLGTVADLVYEVRVVKGYNVYNADQLSVLGNDDNNGWKDWKEKHGLYGINPEAVILQTNIKLTRENIPDAYFISEEEWKALPDIIKNKTNQTGVGSLKDGYDFALYRRTLKEGENFNFYGNYFNINYEDFPRMVLDVDALDGKNSGEGVIYDAQKTDSNTQITTHTTLLKFADGSNSDNNRGNINIQGLSFFGNGKRSTDTRNSGGMMIAKIEGINSEVYNCSYSNTFIGMMFQQSGNITADSQIKSRLIKTQGYDSYNTLIYIYGCKDLLIEDCEFVGAGGPVMIADHVYSKAENYDEGKSLETNVIVINSKMESWVTGNEPWFVSYGADALVPAVKALNAAYKGFNTTFIDDTKEVKGLMNLKVVYKCSSAEGVTNTPVRGSVIFYDSREEYENQKTQKTVYGLDMTEYSKRSVSSGANRLENSRNGTAFGSTTYVIVPVPIGEAGDAIVRLGDMTTLQTLLAEYNKAEDDTQKNEISGKMKKLIYGVKLDNKYYKINQETGGLDGEITTGDISQMELAGSTFDTFSLNEVNYTYGIKAENGVTNINFYVFNGMGIVLELMNA